MKKIASLLLAFLMVLSMVACGDPSATTTSTPPQSSTQTLRVLLESEPSSLDPSTTQLLSSYVYAPIVTAIFIPLLYEDSAGNILPGMASEWEWVDDLHLRLTIQDNIVSHGGTKITASDLQYSFMCGASGPNASYYTMFDFENFVIESETTIVLALNKPYPSLVEAFLSPVYSVYAEQDVLALTDTTDISTLCTGRYVFKEWLPAQSIRVEKNENYFDPDNSGYYDEIVYTFNSDASARALSLQSGDADVVSNIDVSQVSTLEEKGFSINLRDTENVCALFLNCSRPPFDNAKVRQAINLLVNREAIRAILYSGYGSIVNTVFSSATPYYQEYTSSVDVEQAKQLLAEAGYADGFTFKLSGLQNTSLAAEVIQANLKEANITVEIDNMDFGAYVGSRTSGDYDALVGITGGNDFSAGLRAYDGRVSVEEAFGGAQYQDETAYELIDAAQSELDLEARKVAVQAACDYLTEQGVMMGLCSVARCDPSVSSIEGMSFCTSAFVDVSTMHPVN